jgi:pyruvate kinase
MLSGETAIGSYPVETVAVMSRIACAAEPHVGVPDVARILREAQASGEISTQERISLSIFLDVEATEPVAVVTPTLSGATARRASRFRLPVWIVAISPNEPTCQSLQFSYGVQAVHETVRPASWQNYARDWLREHGLTEGLVILTHGSGTAHGGGTNQIEFIDLGRPANDVTIW